MSAGDNPELQQDLIRLLHTENRSLRVQLQDAERKASRVTFTQAFVELNAHQSHAQPPSYADTHLIEMLRKQNQELQQERDALRLQLTTQANKCSDASHIHASEVRYWFCPAIGYTHDVQIEEG